MSKELSIYEQIERDLTNPPKDNEPPKVYFYGHYDKIIEHFLGSLTCPTGQNRCRFYENGKCKRTHDAHFIYDGAVRYDYLVKCENYHTIKVLMQHFKKPMKEVNKMITEFLLENEKSLTAHLVVNNNI